MTRIQQLWVAIVAGCLSACSNQPASLPALAHPPFEAPFDETTVRTINTTIANCPLADDPYYFLPKSFLSWDEREDVEGLRVVNQTLAGLREPSLSCGREPDEAYRLSGAGAFAYQPWSVRVFRHGLRYGLVAVSSGYEFRPVERFWDIERVSKDLSRSDWEALTAQLERDAFWSVDSVDDRLHYFDGAGWLFEGRRADRYHPVRRTATRTGPLVGTAVLLRKLSGLTLESQRFGLGDREWPK